MAVGPILSDSASDIFCGNENSPNFLFHNRGDGTYRDVAAVVGELRVDGGGWGGEEVTPNELSTVLGGTVGTDGPIDHRRDIHDARMQYGEVHVGARGPCPRRCPGEMPQDRGFRLPVPLLLAGLDDPYQHGRGVALADFNRDGRVDIVYGNWNGPHRLYLQAGVPGRVRFRVRAGAGTSPTTSFGAKLQFGFELWFPVGMGTKERCPRITSPYPSLTQDIATPKFSMPSPVRTVIAADFDNDQELEVFFNNIAYRGSSANRLFR